MLQRRKACCVCMMSSVYGTFDVCEKHTLPVLPAHICVFACMGNKLRMILIEKR